MNPLEQRIVYLEQVIATLLRSDRYNFQKHLQFQEGCNIILGTTTGTTIGTATTQKLGLFNATPVVQASAISAPTTPGAVYAQSEAQSAVAAINSLRTAVKNIGITA